MRLIFYRVSIFSTQDVGTVTRGAGFVAGTDAGGLGAGADAKFLIFSAVCSDADTNFVSVVTGCTGCGIFGPIGGVTASEGGTSFVMGSGFIGGSSSETLG